MNTSEVQRDHATVRRYLEALRRMEAPPSPTRRDNEGRHVIQNAQDWMKKS